MNNILLIEDDTDISELMQLTLTDNGYETAICHSIEALGRDNLAGYDLVILDLGLPDGDGKSLIETFTRAGVPVIVLTARTALFEKVKSFDLGADDYVQKPFELQELLARMKAVLRRCGTAVSPFHLEGYHVFADQRRIQNSLGAVDLTAREWDLLLYLLQHRGIVLSRDRLLEQVWGFDYPGTTRTVDVHIQQLRKKLGLSSITTIHRQGYRLER